MQPERLRELLDYDPRSGIIKSKKSQRVLRADEDGLVIIRDPVDKKSYKLKLDKIAYTLAFGVQPKEDKRILHKNLDQQDNRLKNLSMVSRAVFLQIKEAHKNLTGGIRLIAHPTDQFSYVLSWFEQGIEKFKIVQDLVPARELQLKLQLRYSKILTKYCVFDEI